MLRFKGTGTKAGETWGEHPGLLLGILWRWAALQVGGKRAAAAAVRQAAVMDQSLQGTAVTAKVKICQGSPPSCHAPWLPSSLPYRCGLVHLWSRPCSARTKEPRSCHEVRLKEKERKQGKRWRAEENRLLVELEETKREEAGRQTKMEYLLFNVGSVRESSSTAFGREKGITRDVLPLILRFPPSTEDHSS